MSNRKSKILDRCMRVITDERLQHDMNRYNECSLYEISTAKAEAIHDRCSKLRQKRRYAKYSSQYFDTIKKQQEYQQEVAMKEQEEQAIEQQTQEKTQKASNAQQENTPMTDKLTVYKQELLELQHALDRHNKKLLVDIEYYELTEHAHGSCTIEARKRGIELYKTRIEILECQIDSIEDHNHKLKVALQQLRDARISLLQAYTTVIGVLVAENELIAVREQYNAIHGI